MNLYLLAHQDDEYFCLPQLMSDLSNNIDFKVYFLTDGASNTLSSIRNKETIKMLSSIGVKPEQLVFLGTLLKIPDGELHLNMSKAYLTICRQLEKQSITELYFPCYEGGHQDHDSISWIVNALKKKLQSTEKLQFPLYNGYMRSKPFFNVLSLIPNQKTSKKNMYFSFSSILSFHYYRSQAKTWFGLFPFIFIRILKSRTVPLIEYSELYLSERPHVGPLLYEKRSLVSYDEFVEAVEKFSSEIK